jgi:hypothetical protein
LFFH